MNTDAHTKPAKLYVCRGANGDLIFRWTADLGPFEAARSALRASFSCPDDLYFDGRLKAWRLAGDQAEAFQAWANAHFAPDHQRVWTPDPDEGADDPRGRSYRSYTSDHAGQRGGQRGGRRASGRTGTGGRTRGTATLAYDPYAVLHLRQDAPLWACEAIYRAAVKQVHPDAGGSHADAVAANQAIAAIREAHNGQASGAA